MKKTFLPLLFVFSFLKKLLLFPHHHLARLLHASREEKNYCLKMSDISPLSLARSRRAFQRTGRNYFLSTSSHFIIFGYNYDDVFGNTLTYMMNYETEKKSPL